jgi:MFS family permease
MARNRFPAGFYLALAANFLFFSSFQWTYATLPGYVQSIGGSLLDVGLATALFSLSAVASRPILGGLADRWGRRPMLVGGAALFALAPALYAATDAIVPFMAVRLLHGVGLASFTTAYTAFVVDLVAAERRGVAVGLAGSASNLGLLFMPALGAAVAAGLGYEWHWVLAAALAAAGLLLTLTLREPRAAAAGHTRARAWSTARVARLRPVWVATLGGTGLAVFYGVALSYVAPLAAERDLSAAGLYFSASAVAVMLSQSTAGWLSDRIGRRAVAAPGLAVAALAATMLVWVRTDAALIAAGAALGLGWGLVRAGIDTGVADAVGGEARGTALGVLYTGFDAAIGLGSFGLGLVVQAHGYAAAFGLAAAWAVLTLVAYTALGPRRQHPAL